MNHIGTIVLQALSPKFNAASLNLLGLLQAFDVNADYVADAVDRWILDGKNDGSILLASYISDETQFATINFVKAYYKMVFNCDTVPESHLTTIAKWVVDNASLSMADICAAVHEKLAAIDGSTIPFDLSTLPHLSTFKVVNTSIAKKVLETLPVQADLSSLENDDQVLWRFKTHWRTLSDDDQEALSNEPEIHYQDLFEAATYSIKQQLLKWCKENLGVPEKMPEIDIAPVWHKKSATLVLGYTHYENWDSFIQAYKALL